MCYVTQGTSSSSIDGKHQQVQAVCPKCKRPRVNLEKHLPNVTKSLQQLWYANWLLLYVLVREVKTKASQAKDIVEAGSKIVFFR